MKNRTKKFIIFLAVGILVIILFGLIILLQYKKSTSTSFISQSEAISHDKLIVGFSQIGSESAWRTRNTESIFEAAAANNIQILFDDAQQKQSNQLKAIRSFIVYQVDVIVFVPIVEDGWDNVLQEAKDANIPVIIVDRQINADPSLYAGFLGENSFEEGRSAGRFLIDKFKDSEKTDINILELSGTANSSVVINRANGFRNFILEDSRFNIIHSEDGDFLRSRGAEIISRIIQENNGLNINGKKIDVIYSHNDSMTLGLLEVMDTNNLSYDDIVIISIDAEQKSIDALVEGKLNCVVECNPNLGQTLMHLVTNVAAGVPIPRVSYMNETVFTEYDDFSTYTPRGY